MNSFTATGAAALAATLAPNADFAIHEIRLHLSGNGAAESLTATLDSSLGAAFDAVLLSTTVENLTDIVSVQNRYFRKGDEIDFALTNSGTLTYGLEVIWSYQ